MASPFSDTAYMPATVQEQPQPGAQTDKAEKRGGFECEFVEPPPDIFQTNCPICFDIIRDPYQVTCCGYSYCQSCIQRIKADNKPCPTCNTKGFSDYLNKGLKRSLYAFKVQCSHQKDGCGWTGELGQLDVHLNTDPLPGSQLNGCPLTIISCDFFHVGCGVKLPRKDMPEHTRKNLLTHMSLLSISHIKQQAQITRLTNMTQELKTENLLLKEANLESGNVITDLVQELRSLRVIPSKVLTMTNFIPYRRNECAWYSPPIYTHTHGYKLCLKVYANGFGSGEGTHVGVCVNFMRGEFDDSLKWPFRGVISFRALDQVKGQDHRAHSLTYNNTAADHVCSRVTEGERGIGWGIATFIAHNELKYLKSNCIHFQVHKVELD